MQEDEESEGIEYEEEEKKAPSSAYICTNLITPGKKSLADVKVETFNEAMLGLLEAQVVHAGQVFEYPVRIYDPLQAYRWAFRLHMPQTLVPYEEID